MVGMPVSSEKAVKKILTDVSGVLKPSRYQENFEKLFNFSVNALTLPYFSIQDDAAPGSSRFWKVNSPAGSRRESAKEP